jgi:putative efflux protein, MATE family
MNKKMNLLEGPIFSTLMKLSLPIMGTSFIQMAYNLTDMIWIGKLGSHAVAAVGSAGMYMWLSNGLITLSKMGGQVCVGQSIGAHQKESATQYAVGTIHLGVLFGLIYGMFALIFHQQMIAFFHLTSQEVIAQAEIYLMLTCGFVIVHFMNQILTGLMTAIGNSQHPFIATTAGLILNIILDPLFIFTFDMGVMGAALATIIAQVVVFIFMIVFAKRDTILFDQMNILEKQKKEVFYKILKIGVPTGIQSMCFTFISMIIARFIATFGDVAIAVQKVGSQIESITWMSTEGFGSAVNAFTAQNYGAKSYERVTKGNSISLKTSLLWGLLTTFLLFVFARPVFQIFISEKDVIPLGVDYLQILAFSQLFVCIEGTLGGILNGLGKTYIPSTVSITLTAARIPLVMILVNTPLGLNGIWWAITLSSIAKGIVILICFVFTFKKLPQNTEV